MDGGGGWAAAPRADRGTAMPAAPRAVKDTRAPLVTSNAIEHQLLSIAASRQTERTGAGPSAAPPRMAVLRQPAGVGTVRDARLPLVNGSKYAQKLLSIAALSQT